MGWLDSLTGLFGGTSTPSVSDVNYAVAPDASLGNVAQTVTTDAPTPAGGGFSWGDILGGASGVAKQVAPLAGLATTGLGIYSGIEGMKQGAQQQKLLTQAQHLQQQTAAPAAAAGAALTSAGQTAMLGGALPPQLESQVQQKTEELRAQIKAYLAHANITDSSMAAEYEGWIKEREMELRSQLAQNLLQSGYTGTATALGPSSALAQESAGLMGGISKDIGAANQAIALLTGSSDDPKRQATSG